MRPVLICMFLATFWAHPSVAQTPCHGAVACPLDGRSYHVREPDDWDGVSPLPVLLHFHGWQRQGDLIVKHQRISGATRRRGVLLLAPNGRNRTWDFRRPGSADTDFALAVIADAATRYPVDRARIYVSGYSYGSRMAWRMGCEAGDGIAALLSISGTLDPGETCATVPRQVRHVHGLKDTVLRFPAGPANDPTYPVVLWRARMGCGTGVDAGTWQVTGRDLFARQVWADCDAQTGARVTLDVHGGGHWIPRGWIGRQLDELLGRAPTYP